jgi:transcriptional regulator with XRE-family HTH domain
MPVRDPRLAIARRKGQQINRMIGAEVRSARRMAGVSQATLGSAVGLSDSEVSRVEQGAAEWLTVIHAAELLGAVGLNLWAKTFPAGPPLRDAAHLRLLADFETRLAPGIRRQREWPLPGDRDRRAVDLLLLGLPRTVGVEAETVLDDLQALERDVNLKQRDAGIDLMLLLVRGSLRNRRILRGADALRSDFPLRTRGILAALGRGQDPGANGIVIL